MFKNKEKVMRLTKNGKKTIVKDKKKIEFYKSLIDEGMLPRCKYKMISLSSD
jgi:hypothetical protein